MFHVLLSRCFERCDPRGSCRGRKFLTCPDIDLPEPQRSAAILRRLREPCGEDDPVYRHFAAKVAAGEVLVPNGKIAFED